MFLRQWLIIAYIIIKVAPNCSIEIIFLYLQSLFSHSFLCLLKFQFSCRWNMSSQVNIEAETVFWRWRGVLMKNMPFACMLHSLV